MPMEDKSDIEVYDAFISYNRGSSKAFAIRLRDELARISLYAWLDQNDIEIAEDWRAKIEDGITRSKYFLFIISPESVASPYCKEEIDMALAYGKSIIPIMHRDCGNDLIIEKHPEISKINYLWMREGNGSPDELTDDFPENLQKLADRLGVYDSYLSTHTELLIKAYEWKKNGQPNSMLLRGLELEQAETWLRNKETQACSIHEEYIKASREMAGKLITEAFLCYGPNNEAFARKLNKKLQLYGKITWFDQTYIQGGDLHRNTQSKSNHSLLKGIENCDNFLFLITEEALKEQECIKQLETAVMQNKRIVPIQCDQTNESLLKKEFYERVPKNLITEKVLFAERPFESAFGQLVHKMEVDQEHVASSNYWHNKAREWDSNNQNPENLIGETQYPIAKDWFNKARRAKKQPMPSTLLERYLNESKAEIDRKEAKEVRDKKIRKRLLVLSNIGFVVAMALGFFALKLYLDSEASKQELMGIQKATLQYIELGNEFGYESDTAQNKRDTVEKLSTKLTIFEENGLKGYKNILNDTVIAPRFEEADEFDDNGRAEVGMNGHDFIINRKGQIIYYKDQQGQYFDFRRQVAVVNKPNGKQQLMSATQADFIPKTEYDFISEDTESGITRVQNDGKWGMISLDGDVVLRVEYDEIDSVAPCGVSKIRLGNKWGLINTMGQEKLPIKYDLLLLSADNERGGCVISLEEGDRSFKGHLLGSQIEELSVIHSDGSQEPLDFGGTANLAPLKNENEKWGYMDRQGKMRIPYQFDMAWPFDHELGYAVAQEGDQYYMIGPDTARMQFPVVRYRNSHILEEIRSTKSYVSSEFIPVLDQLNSKAKQLGIQIKITGAMDKMENYDSPNARYGLGELGMRININIKYGHDYSRQFSKDDFWVLGEKFRQGGNAVSRLKGEVDDSIYGFLAAIDKRKDLLWGGKSKADNAFYLQNSELENDRQYLKKVQVAYILAEKYNLSF